MNWKFDVLRSLGLLACLAALAGCAPLPLDGRSDAERVRERSEARWAAVLALNFDEVYRFAAPSYRNSFSVTHLKNQYGAQVHRKSVDIGEARIDEADPSRARVNVLLEFESSGAQAGPIYEGVSRLDETWVKHDGEWWYVEPR